MTDLMPRDRWLLIAVMFTVFSSAWVLTKEPAEIYAGYLIFLALFPVFISRYGVPGKFWLYAGFFLLTGVLNVVLGNNEMAQFLKIYLGVLASYLFYYYVFERFEFDVKLLFRYYLKAAYIVTLIGLIQFISFQLRFTPGYDFHWLGIFNKWAVVTGGNFGIRVNAVFGEPSQYAAIMAPAFFVALYNILRFQTFEYSRIRSILVILVYLLTFSSLGYIGIFISLLLLLINFGLLRYLIFVIPIAIGAFVYLYNNVEDFRYRWDSTFIIFRTGEIDIRSIHGSSIVFYNNYVIATENFKSNFLLGTGLGSHGVASNKYSLTKEIKTFGFANNLSDANSMFLRIISEQGLVGVIMVFAFIIRGFVRRQKFDPDNPYWIISSAALTVILLYLFRQGHYFINGFPFFAWLYYYARKNYEYELAEEEELEEDEEETESAETEIHSPEIKPA